MTSFALAGCIPCAMDPACVPAVELSRRTLERGDQIAIAKALTGQSQFDHPAAVPVEVVDFVLQHHLVTPDATERDPERRHDLAQRIQQSLAEMHAYEYVAIRDGDVRLMVARGKLLVVRRAPDHPPGWKVTARISIRDLPLLHVERPSGLGWYCYSVGRRGYCRRDREGCVRARTQVTELQESGQFPGAPSDECRRTDTATCALLEGPTFAGYLCHASMEQCEAELPKYPARYVTECAVWR
jgi:hypothetical protein